MRKIMTVAIMTLFMSSAFASDGEVNPAVETAFKAKFPGASEVEWSKVSNYYKVSFSNNGAPMFACFNENAKFMGLIKYIRSTQLPGDLQSKLKPYFSHYWITDLFETSHRGSKDYYITFRSANGEIVLESRDGNDWRLLTIETKK